MKVFVEEQRFKKWILAGIMIVPLAGGLIPLLLGKEEIPEFNSEAFWGLSITFIIVLAVMGLLLSIKLSTKINEQGIYYQFFPIHFSEKFIAWTSIEQCYITKYNSLSKFGGYGYRVCMFGKKKGTIMNVGGKTGIQLVLKNRKRILLGTQMRSDAERILATYSFKFITNEK